ncbi:MAG: Xaa-Pro peptidase family protein [Methanomicrobiales archaeon]|nr:Xaa-Pro peptidase family protein [Methanomicrobiales archaeon]
MDDSNKIPGKELKDRMNRFRAQMDQDNPEWELAVFFGRINLLYFTGTIQDGMLFIPRVSEGIFWVRRSYERAIHESHFPRIRPMGGFREAATASGTVPGTAYMETEVVPIALSRRFRKYFPVREVRPLDAQIAKVRAVKSSYELSCMEQAGNIHRRVLEDYVPEILSDGMSEAEFGGELFSVMVQEGHHGIVRFGMFGTEIVLGQIGFGESSVYPTCFDGPGGCYGMGPAVPLLGSHERKLRRGDLVFVDTACGVNGYHTDKTMTYMFGKALPDDVIEVHQRCVEIQDEMASLLKPGVAPSRIYATIMEGLSPEFLRNFMGFGERRANFLGHGVGLVVDEMPVIAAGFDEPLEQGMVLALEPKKGISGIGMVGTENTFVVTSNGGRSLTGKHPGLIPVY